MAMSQALSLTNDLKLGWYTSIPPREMFVCQILGTVLGALTNCAYLASYLSLTPLLHLPPDDHLPAAPTLLLPPPPSAPSTAQTIHPLTLPR